MKRSPSITRRASNFFLVRIDRVKQASDATALICGGESLSYAELDRWSSAVAAQLTAETSCPPDTPIGIFAPSGLEYFAALLGIWKAGAMAVPLQPAHPAEELQYIVANSGLKT